MQQKGKRGQLACAGTEMADVKISNDFYVPRNRVDYYFSYNSYTAQGIVRKWKSDAEIFKNIIDVTAKKKTSTVVVLLSGKIILTATSVDTIRKRMEDAEKAESRLTPK